MNFDIFIFRDLDLLIFRRRIKLSGALGELFDHGLGELIFN